MKLLNLQLILKLGLFVWREITDNTSSPTTDTSLKKGMSYSITIAAPPPSAHVKGLNKLIVKKPGVRRISNRDSNGIKLSRSVMRTNVRERLRLGEAEYAIGRLESQLMDTMYTSLVVWDVELFVQRTFEKRSFGADDAGRSIRGINDCDQNKVGGRALVAQRSDEHRTGVVALNSNGTRLCAGGHEHSQCDDEQGLKWTRHRLNN
jgi:hypothetical protein